MSIPYRIEKVYDNLGNLMDDIEDIIYDVDAGGGLKDDDLSDLRSVLSDLRQLRQELRSIHTGAEYYADNHEEE